MHFKAFVAGAVFSGSAFAGTIPGANLVVPHTNYTSTGHSHHKPHWVYTGPLEQGASVEWVVKGNDCLLKLVNVANCTTTTPGFTYLGTYDSKAKVCTRPSRAAQGIPFANSGGLDDCGQASIDYFWSNDNITTASSKYNQHLEAGDLRLTYDINHKPYVVRGLGDKPGQGVEYDGKKWHQV